MHVAVLVIWVDGITDRWLIKTYQPVMLLMNPLWMYCLLLSRQLCHVKSNFKPVYRTVSQELWDDIGVSDCEGLLWCVYGSGSVGSEWLMMIVMLLQMAVLCNWQTGVALTLCQQLATAMGPSIKQYVRVLGAGIVSNFGDSKVSWYM